MARPLPLIAPEIPELANDAPAPRVVADRLLAWFASHGRVFSWRASSDPFYVLVAEILLRKTGAAAVEQHLPRIMAAYPSPQALAEAPEAEVITALAPLGLSRQRAVQLQALGRALQERFGGTVPCDVEELASLPAVGSYTTGIVASTCCRERVPAVDGNVARLLCRVFDLTPTHLEARKSTNVWQLAAVLMESAGDSPVQLTWAELDLAAAVCTARKPEHTACPLQDMCLQVKREQEAGH